ncbi:GNAT family N-acetyltransferase [Virgibacillus ihumii]|uniref:GNAT family N-acetyltransferase n=1 Tax=Virgibacillus ihumii TaxID=2686091 RepID=UPI00157CB25D|nr:GNAT family protein [Virgibacillus ihumii]
MDIGKTIPVLETENYVLRGVTKNDASDLFPFLSDRETMKYITPHPVKTEAEVANEILLQLEKFNRQKEIPWVIADKHIETVIGTFSFHKLHMWHRKAEMAAIICHDYQNSGVMTEVLGKTLYYGFDILGLNRIVGDIFAGNTGSRKLLQRHGFVEEGTMRQTDFDGQIYHDTVVYSQLKSEYDAYK